MNTTTILECRDVWKIYGAKADSFLTHTPDPQKGDLRKHNLIGAVRRANVQIRKGEIFVIMGLSGSGKSTLVRCLSRLVEPTAGEIFFEGKNLLSMNEAELIHIRRTKMGMVFQQFALLPHLTVLENAAFPLDVQGIDKVTREDRAMEMVELVGLKGRENNYPRELSGGQQQRVGIARSLVVEPDLWFLDEPFSALDPLIRREMQDEFMRLQNMLHKTIVFITHDFDEAIRLADRIAVMKDGEIQQVATPEELVLNPATDYVAEFTRYVSRSKVITAGSVIQPLQDGTFAGTVDHKQLIDDIASQIEGANAPYRVEKDGEVIGQITRQAVIDVLVGRA
ncbi:betaine/proline/choline family ABC transporter ATP-binding protein [Sulfitobacter sp. M57]|uniref:quaternary amine ABC transporter ATP-binding protein n=1 Tax=unclassified Sulfitobacter TaxID=196795 RepID=UPI0023E2982A|nr:MULTISPECIES: betaine/proline/choline family ABC transporter ATP-binding protein [unclassified Sulfitobacter]MDF3415482.1 betaine/proline/choline family ABC transporter ATP-binding protein [Sulfitobacter sp. KE5]MDF3422963.1 betaine/proline/choline family ABC transporter ATP-binding protein [Sulfitobacter sp. KE43]MDF3434028.1 betaine/proline/choline family ABC transporter ATP-binding protein [Sulfitobacter sp. KE42]MDF3459939.1 betaine/proline/choline family ABC transporter ATP-binding prot